MALVLRRNAVRGVLRKNVVRALLGVAVPAQSQRLGLAEAEYARESACFQGSSLSIIPGWIEETRAHPGSPTTADLIVDGRQVGDSLLAPKRILSCHFRDEPASRDRDRRAPGPALPSPEELEALAVPADQRFRFDDDEGWSPAGTHLLYCLDWPRNLELVEVASGTVEEIAVDLYYSVPQFSPDGSGASRWRPLGRALRRRSGPTSSSPAEPAPTP